MTFRERDEVGKCLMASEDERGLGKSREDSLCFVLFCWTTCSQIRFDNSSYEPFLGRPYY
jgi:hypothetical protein